VIHGALDGDAWEGPGIFTFELTRAKFMPSNFLLWVHGFNHTGFLDSKYFEENYNSVGQSEPNTQASDLQSLSVGSEAQNYVVATYVVGFLRMTRGEQIFAGWFRGYDSPIFKNSNPEIQERIDSRLKVTTMSYSPPDVSTSKICSVQECPVFSGFQTAKSHKLLTALPYCFHPRQGWQLFWSKFSPPHPSITFPVNAILLTDPILGTSFQFDAVQDPSTQQVNEDIILLVTVALSGAPKMPSVAVRIPYCQVLKTKSNIKRTKGVLSTVRVRLDQFPGITNQNLKSVIISFANAPLSGGILISDPRFSYPA